MENESINLSQANLESKTQTVNEKLLSMELKPKQGKALDCYRNTNVSSDINFSIP